MLNCKKEFYSTSGRHEKRKTLPFDRLCIIIELRLIDSKHVLQSIVVQNLNLFHTFNMQNCFL